MALSAITHPSFQARRRIGLRLGGILLALSGLLGSPAAQAESPKTAKKAAAATPCPTVLKHSFKRLQDDVPQNLCQYAGKVVLVVNTASYCGFTGQYEGLEALYARYQPQGLVVLGFPSNDFGKQEPGTDKQIAEFCFNTYGVKFPMFSKTVVSGPQRNLLYSQLAEATGTTPKWNFYKYLIDRSGRVVDSYSSMTSPTSRSLIADIEKALSAS